MAHSLLLSQDRQRRVARGLLWLRVRRYRATQAAAASQACRWGTVLLERLLQRRPPWDATTAPGPPSSELPSPAIGSVTGPARPPAACGCGNNILSGAACHRGQQRVGANRLWSSSAQPSPSSTHSPKLGSARTQLYVRRYRLALSPPLSSLWSAALTRGAGLGADPSLATGQGRSTMAATARCSASRAAAAGGVCPQPSEIMA